ncbi:hypothetical protein M0R45_007160 [Rubus argutus]|uniref:Uncharacterized protein n=1 Tax=Rubus argutus TaxID=59490 RepID=A0AAW1YU19_RUBAR
MYQGHYLHRGERSQDKEDLLHKVTQYKKGKDSLSAQGKRRYDGKQSGYGLEINDRAETVDGKIKKLDVQLNRYK